MGAIISIAGKFVEYPVVWELCLLFVSKYLMEKILKNNHKALDEAMDKREVPRWMTRQGGYVNGFEVSESMTSTLNEIMMALTQTNISILGLYGSSNARRVNAVEKIMRRVKRDKVFDVVVMVRVMEKPDLRRIQGQLGNMLGIQLHEKSLEGRARCLCDGIKMKEKILMIVDDLWGGINLSRIGIPFGDDHKGCKILLVSHTQEVLSQMNTQIEFSL